MKKTAIAITLFLGLGTAAYAQDGAKKGACCASKASASTSATCADKAKVSTASTTTVSEAPKSCTKSTSSCNKTAAKSCTGSDVKKTAVVEERTSARPTGAMMVN